MSEWIFVIGLLALIAAICLIMISNKKTTHTIDALEKMILDAQNGEFRPDRYDETRLSKVESELADYLSSSAISARNVENEKNNLAALITDISHQTKTPIANLILYGDMLEESELSQEQRDNVDAIRSQAEKLRFLIDSLIKLSRLESGIISLERTKVSMGPILKNIRDQLKEKAEAKGIALNLSETDIMAEIDPKWTQEALFNIADNAVKYTPSGSVTLRASEYELFVRIDIEDTGIGIPEEERTLIFGRFYRSPKVKNAEGVGIGLHLAREIINGEGGYIKVEPGDPCGTRFCVYLPKA